MTLSRLLRSVGLGLAALVLSVSSLSPAMARTSHAKPAAPPAHELYSDGQKSQQFTACQDLFPAGRAINISAFRAEQRVSGLCSNHFAVVYSAQSKTPLMVVERLNKAQLKDAEDEERTDRFFADPRLKRGDRAELKDFEGSGHDRGHLSPAGDQPDLTSMAQSFALTNMVPEDPTHNRKTWRKVESDVRKYVRRAAGDVFVFTGVLFPAQPQKIGRNQVWVPSHLFKLVYDATSHRSFAHVIANTADARITAPMGYEDFAKVTGWRVLDGLSLAGAVAAR